MSKKSLSQREHFLSQFYSFVKKKKSKHANLLFDFAKQYYALLSFEDLSSREFDTLYSIMKMHWDMLYQHAPGDIQIDVFNPEEKTHGWHSQHTAVSIVCDDMPFLVDSVRMEMNRRGLSIHYVVHLGGVRVRRNEKNQVTEILGRAQHVSESVVDAPIYLEIDRQTDPEVLLDIKKSLYEVLSDVQIAVNDWEPMLGKLDESLSGFGTVASADPAEIAESKAFLSWLKEHFIFFGVRDHHLTKVKKKLVLRSVSHSGLGVLRSSKKSSHDRYLSDLTEAGRDHALSSNVLVISKTNTHSTIHRSGYTDYIGVKLFNDKGEIIGERRFIGLYTSTAYNSSARRIPFLRLKVAKVLQQTGFASNSHAGKKIVNILETLPRDDLFQSSAKELQELVLGIFHLQERERTRLFIREDLYGRYYSCLVYIPRSNFSTELTQRIQDVLLHMLHGEEIEYSIYFSASVLVRVHFVVRISSSDKTKREKLDINEIEAALIKLSTSWYQELYHCLLDYHGEAKGINYFNEYSRAFSASYQELYSANTAITDIEYIESLRDDKPLSMNFYRPDENLSGIFRFKVYQSTQSIPLSDALPILENMGFRILGENPSKVRLPKGGCVWINDFDLILKQEQEVDVKLVRDTFQRSFAAIWLGLAENDAFNQLVLKAAMTWQEVSVFRAYARYFRQINFNLSQNYIAETLRRYPHIARALIDYFNARFSPEQSVELSELKEMERAIKKSLDTVTQLNEDRVLRRYLACMKATLRTNYFQREENGSSKPYLSFKLSPSKIPEIPLPVPMFEIFVYSMRFEGVHLRGARVARGGLRWSDRREDFRTEILGLMKAQQVKNAVIVPAGAKGGFVPKKLPIDLGRDAVLQEGIECYQNFIRALLDITDNICRNHIVPPAQVVRYDDDDPYLVVAADKGTATFSDIANSISSEYGFWLGDAFASGGSAGYDHKKMGITAKGGWESVKRHFREMDIDIQTTPFTAIGVGDMSGDVFGNGMLLSPCIKLVAAFNHMHIFIDPDPDPKVSYKERQRLFKLSRSSWNDYQADLISKGGGVFERAAKSIRLTPEIKKLLNIRKDSLTPNDLIQAILRAEVDLFWNGGIGTYVKASYESHLDVGDKTNDALRVNADELRCRVIGEGGNLGLTQLARIQFSLNGGRCFTDFIDNSAGVDCSDHEVNIKILLNEVMQQSEFSLRRRNTLLSKMTDEISHLVLQDNYDQTEAISMAAEKSIDDLDLYIDFMCKLEKKGILNRKLEGLPDDKALVDRRAQRKGLTRPEMAVLLSYSKMVLKQEILDSDLPDGKYANLMLEFAFPKRLVRLFPDSMSKHRLRREIIATQIANKLINQMGVTFIQRIQQETQITIPEIVRAYTASDYIFGIKDTWEKIQLLDLKIPVELQFFMMRQLARQTRQATRWILRYRGSVTEVAELIKEFSKPTDLLFEYLQELLSEEDRNNLKESIDALVSQGVPNELAFQISAGHYLLASLDIVDAAKAANKPMHSVAKVYFRLAEKLNLTWLREQIVSFQVDDRWTALARSSFRKELDYLQRMLTINVLKQKKRFKNVDEKIDVWISKQSHIVERYQHRMTDVKSSAAFTSVMFSVLLRDLFEVAQ